MNEYQDQVVWWEVQRWHAGRQCWLTVSDHDTRKQAEHASYALGGKVRVKRTFGLPA